MMEFDILHQNLILVLYILIFSIIIYQVLSEFALINESNYKEYLPKYYEMFKVLNWACKLSFSIEGS